MTVGSILRHAAHRWPDSEALVTDSRQLTYQELLEVTNSFAHGLQNRGIEKGDAIGIFTRNSIEQIISYLAVQTLGAVAVPVNPRLSVNELNIILDEAEASIVICGKQQSQSVHQVQSEFRTVSQCIATGSTDEMLSFTSAIEGEPSTTPDATVNLSDPGVMMHTSGTTGKPKLVVLTHRGQLLNSMACVIELGYGPTDCALHIAPLYHSAGYLNLFLPCLQIGAKHVIQRDFTPERTLENIETESVTVSLGVPTHYQRLQQVDSGSFDVSTLRLLVTSGASVSHQTANWVEQHMCETLINAYGMTETCGLVTTTSNIGGSNGAHRIGNPFLNVDTRLIEIGEGISPDQTVEPGERGQLIVQSPKIMNGYYGKPGKTKETIYNGWLYTKDVAVERDGEYYLLDRIDNQIISGGENIYPQEIERILNEHPDVVECGVDGINDPEFGERVVAYVVTDDPKLTLEDIDEFWKSRTDAPGFKRPRELRIVESIPRNASGKILRDKLSTKTS